MPLRGTSRLTLSTSGPAAGSPSRARVLARSIGSQRDEADVSTPGGIWAIGEAGSDDAAGFRFGVAARGDHEASALRAPGPEQRSAAGQPARDGHLGAVQHHRVGQTQARADQAEGHGRIEDRPPRRRLPRPGGRTRRARTGSGSSTGSRVRWIRKG